jgi:hypothetical protein
MNSPKQFIAYCCLLLPLTLLNQAVHAQQLPDSSSCNQRSVANIQRFVQSRLDPDSRLYNGYEYIRNGIPAKGFAFFDSAGLQTGTLSYDGIFYPNLPLEYDVVSDQVIIQDYTARALISLISQKVGHFSIGTHSFRYIDVGKASLLKAGFYEELYAAPSLLLLARHEKKLVYSSNREEQPRYYSDDTYFLGLKDEFYRVNGQADLLDLLKDKKDALKKHIRDNKIRFRKDMEKALIQTTAYYLQIRN